jgi:NAD-dependent SIR2 family protein deacetylase
MCSINDTLAKCESVSLGVEDVFERWEKLKQAFQDALDRSVDQIAQALTGPLPTKHVRPKGLNSLDLAGVAGFINSPHCKHIAFLTGAGVSVAAGIPDYRSSGGMYSTLRPDAISASPAQRGRMGTHPNYVMSKGLFEENPRPYMEVKRPFILGAAERKWKPTLFHWLQRLCESKGKLLRVYTQNIDNLDGCTGLPQKKVLPVHGTMGTASCGACGHGVGIREFADLVRTRVKDVTGTDPGAPAETSAGGESACACPACGELRVKNDIVLFGEDLPKNFSSWSAADMPRADLLVVAGTSLQVAPANSLVSMVRDDCARVLINREPVGMDLGLAVGPSGDNSMVSVGAGVGAGGAGLHAGGEKAREDATKGTANTPTSTAGKKKRSKAKTQAKRSTASKCIAAGSDDNKKEEGRDIFLAGNSDEVSMDLIRALGWEADLITHICMHSANDKQKEEAGQSQRQSQIIGESTRSKKQASSATGLSYKTRKQETRRRSKNPKPSGLQSCLERAMSPASAKLVLQAVSAKSLAQFEKEAFSYTENC